jgi:hypothetical protein
MKSNGYPVRWRHLQIGVSVEYIVLGLILRTGFKLSDRLGVRVNGYTPCLDIDSVDSLIRLEGGGGGAWSIGIEVSVRSSSRPIIVLGRENQYSSLMRWLARSKARRTPCLLFQFDLSQSRLFVFSPAMLQSLGADGKRASVRLPTEAQDDETLFRLLADVSSCATETEARNLLCFGSQP